MSLYRIYKRIFRDLSTYLQKVAMYICICELFVDFFN